nr:MAG TPA: hypothetical protein [Caudoviricetes sp.]
MTIRGYVSRRLSEPLYEEYNGRFGGGFRELIPNWDSSQYSYVRYWIVA